MHLVVVIIVLVKFQYVVYLWAVFLTGLIAWLVVYIWLGFPCCVGLLPLCVCLDCAWVSVGYCCVKFVVSWLVVRVIVGLWVSSFWVLIYVWLCLNGKLRLVLLIVGCGVELGFVRCTINSVAIYVFEFVVLYDFVIACCVIVYVVFTVSDCVCFVDWFAVFASVLPLCCVWC